MLNKTPYKTKAIILDCEGTVLTDEERALFKMHNPHGFILFQRNCESPEQLRALVKDLRDAVGRDDAPVLIDQEGGSVARLKKPNFDEFPSARFFADQYKTSPKKTAEAVFENAKAMAKQLIDLGVTVNCTPILDVPCADTHEFLKGSRVYGDDVETVTALGRQVCLGHLACGVTPILKHIPGHGQATCDSHLDLPKISSSYNDLANQDFKPFKSMVAETWGQGVWAMTAHVLYQAVDKSNPGSLSSAVIKDIIRDEIGFDGVLIADDISMKALKGDYADLAVKTLAAGCDLTLLCNQDFETRKAVLEATPLTTAKAHARLERAEALRLEYQAKKQSSIKKTKKFKV